MTHLQSIVARVPGVQSVDKSLRSLDHGIVIQVATRPVRPIARVHVLTQVNAPIPHVPEHFLKCHSLLLHEVASVVDKDVQAFGEIGFELGPKRRVSLIPNDDPDPPFLELLAIGIHIHADVAVKSIHVGDINVVDIHLNDLFFHLLEFICSEVRAPHLDGAPALHAHLDHRNSVLRTKAIEVPVVRVQVPRPLVGARPSGVASKPLE